MSSLQLSKGALKQVFSKEGHDSVQIPMILQITNIKAFDVLPSDLKKFRILVNDGVYSTHGLIDESCSEYIKNNNCQRYAIVQVNAFSIFATLKHFFVIKNFEVLAPTSEKSPNNIIPIDTYFLEHPEENYLTVMKKSESRDRESPVPGVTPPLAQSTNSFKSEVGGGVAAQSKPAGTHRKVSPIETISPYQNNWTIKARVSYKGDLRTWSNSKGEGKVFGFNLLDESDEIKASAFNETAERAHKLLEEGKVYYISKARVAAARKKFNTLSHPYELTFDKDTEITECFDESDVPKLNFNFVKLDQVQNLEANAIIDVLGALKTVFPPFQITAKSTGKVFDRRNILVVDETGFGIELGLWNNTATDFNIEEGTVVAVKGCKVSDYDGRTLSLTQAGSIIPNPGTPESFKLKGWYDNIGIHELFKSLKIDNAGSGGDKISQRISINQALEEHSGSTEKPDYFSIKANVTFCKPENFAYPACPNLVQNADATRPAQVCNKKLVFQDNDGTWRCERCAKTYEEPTWRYVLSCSVTDSTGHMWVTLFNDQAEKLLGIDATELVKKKEQKSEVANQIMNNTLFKEFSLRVKAKQETYNDELKTRYLAAGINELDYASESQFLIKKLDQLLK